MCVAELRGGYLWSIDWILSWKRNPTWNEMLTSEYVFPPLIKIQMNMLTRLYTPCYFILYYLQHVSAHIEPTSDRQITGVTYI
jgi:hypothetical protein